MNFSIANTAQKKHIHIDCLDGGLKTAESTDKTNKLLLSDCKNVWFNQGFLQSRPGLLTQKKNFIDDTDYRDGFYYHFRPCNVEIFYNGETKKLIVEEIEYDDSVYICLVHLAGSDGVIENTSQLNFHRTSGSVFYIPQKLLFYKGKAQSGGGIFALATLVNMENFDQYTYKIFEIDSDFSQWKEVTSFYIPTVYINGRGNKYEIAEASNQAFTGKPTMLENLNLLNGTFYAYFSSDGRSNSFRLPYSNIADENVICRIHTTLKEYTEWIIPKGSNSVSNSFFGNKVTMHVDRAKGIIYFTVEAGDYEVPLMSNHNENNMRILATKKCEFNLKDIISSTVSVSEQDKVVLANKNTVFAADNRKPLYFPKSSVTTVGEDNSPITALIWFKNNLLAFKSDSIYTIDIKASKPLNSISLLADNDSTFYLSDNITVTPLSENIGCTDKNSIIVKEDYLLWEGKKDCIYALASPKGTIESFNTPFNDSSSSKTYGFYLENYHIFLKGKTAYVMNKISNQISWYKWEFTEEISFIGAFNISNTPWVMCYNPKKEICFLATFSGHVDTLLEGNIYNPSQRTMPIKSYFCTDKINFGCNNSLKKVDTISLQLQTVRCNIRINDRLEAVVCRHQHENLFETIKMYPGICGTNGICISLETEKSFKLGNIDIGYTLLEL